MIAAAVLTAAAIAPFDGWAGPDTSEIATCGAATLGPEFRKEVVLGMRYDAALLEQAVLHFTNRARCSAGLGPLIASPDLNSLARYRAGDPEFERLRKLAAEYRERRFATAPSEAEFRGGPVILSGDRPGAVPGHASLVLRRSGMPSWITPLTGPSMRSRPMCGYLHVFGWGERFSSYETMANLLVSGWLGHPAAAKRMLASGTLRHGFALVRTNRDMGCSTAVAIQILSD